MGSATDVQKSGSQTSLTTQFSSKSPTTFHSFALLPLELQNQVWTSAIHLFPRILSFHCNNEGYRYLLVVRGEDGKVPEIPSNISAWDFMSWSTLSFSQLRPGWGTAPSPLVFTCRASWQVFLDSCCAGLQMAPRPCDLVLRDTLHMSSGQDTHLEIVPHEEVTSTGFRFQPVCDTLYFDETTLPYPLLHPTLDNTLRIECGAIDNQLKTDNIRSLAIPTVFVNQILLQYQEVEGHFGQLEEIIAVVPWHDGFSRRRLHKGRASLNEIVQQSRVCVGNAVKAAKDAFVKAVRAESPHVRRFSRPDLLNIKIMSEQAMIKYVTGGRTAAVFGGIPGILEEFIFPGPVCVSLDQGHVILELE